MVTVAVKSDTPEMDPGQTKLKSNMGTFKYFKLFFYRCIHIAEKLKCI